MPAFMLSITDQEALTAIVGKRRSRKALKPNFGKHKTPA